MTPGPHLPQLPILPRQSPRVRLGMSRMHWMPGMHWMHWARPARKEQGTAAIELVLMAPLLMVILLFVVGLGRMAHARQQLESVASDSARAASLERNTAQSATAARTAAQQSLGDAGVSCTGLTVNVDLTSYAPGGQIKVTVSCTTRLSDLALAGFPGTKTFTASSTVPIETYRSN